MVRSAALGTTILGLALPITGDHAQGQGVWALITPVWLPKAPFSVNIAYIARRLLTATLESDYANHYGWLRRRLHRYVSKWANVHAPEIENLLV